MASPAEWLQHVNVSCTDRPLANYCPPYRASHLGLGFRPTGFRRRTPPAVFIERTKELARPPRNHINARNGLRVPLAGNRPSAFNIWPTP
eukprot:scaffold18289_cov17-Prasinocladus_malaysianus.AAC.2